MTENFQQILKTPGKVMMLKLNDLNVDRENYQRPIQNYSKKIARNFDPRACLPLVVFQRQDKSYWVIDGQQRRQALLQNGHAEWLCIVHESDGPETEARLFALVGGGSGTTRKLSVKDLFKAQLTSKDSLALSIKKAVEDAGFVLDIGTGNVQSGHVCCLNTLKRLVSVYGGENLTRSLRVLAQTWPEDKEAMRYMIVHGITCFFGNNPKSDDDRFIRVVGASPVRGIIQEAAGYIRSGDMGAMSYAAIVRRWNKNIKLANRLPENLKEVG